MDADGAPEYAGLGRRWDPVAAAEWLERAAAQGHPDAWFQARPLPFPLRVPLPYQLPLHLPPGSTLGRCTSAAPGCSARRRWRCAAGARPRGSGARRGSCSSGCAPPPPSLLLPLPMSLLYTQWGGLGATCTGRRAAGRSSRATARRLCGCGARPRPASGRPRSGSGGSATRGAARLRPTRRALCTTCWSRRTRDLRRVSSARARCSRVWAARARGGSIFKGGATPAGSRCCARPRRRGAVRRSLRSRRGWPRAAAPTRRRRGRWQRRWPPARPPARPPPAACG